MQSPAVGVGFTVDLRRTISVCNSDRSPIPLMSVGSTSSPPASSSKYFLCILSRAFDRLFLGDRLLGECDGDVVSFGLKHGSNVPNAPSSSGASESMQSRNPAKLDTRSSPSSTESPREDDGAFGRRPGGSLAASAGTAAREAALSDPSVSLTRGEGAIGPRDGLQDAAQR